MAWQKLSLTKPSSSGLLEILQEPLGYARWENFMTAIKRAIESCETTGYELDNHFCGVTIMAA